MPRIVWGDGGRPQKVLRGRPPYLAPILILLAMVVSGLSSCARESIGDSIPPEARDQEQQHTTPASSRPLRVALQYGLAYAPLTLVERFDLMEKQMPGMEVEWVQLGNAAAIREAMLANRLDVGFMGIPPFLIGADRGMEWRIFTGLSEAPLALITIDPSLMTLEDLEPDHRIAVPQPGSIQHILLSMGAEQAFGDPNRFDNRLVTLAHPDAMTALLARTEIAAHFASPPYIFEELATDGGHSLMSGREAFGGTFTFIVGVMRPDAASSRSIEALTVLVAALEEAIQMLNSASRAAIEELASLYGMSASTLRDYLAHPEMRYTTEVVGVGRFAEAMKRYGYLNNPVDASALVTELRRQQ